MSASDVIHWCNHWAFTYDPRESDPVVPFDLFPKQEEFLRWLSEREAKQQDGLVEKSRDMGATWLCCVYALHGWLFRDGFSAGFGSRKLELVDRIGDLDSIFEKIRFLLYNLPGWMLPHEFKRSEHDNHARLINPANGASITGEGGDNIGRGGRKSIYFVDEAAFLDHAHLVERSLSQTTRVRIDVSTPNGPGNPFARRRFGGKVPVFTLHWKTDPRKGEAWYQGMKDAKDAVTVAQEIDIDYTASVDGITIPAAWVRAAVGLKLPASGPKIGGLDIAEEGKDVTVLVARQGPVVQAIESWSHCNTTETAWRARDEGRRQGLATMNYDCGGVGAGVKGTWLTSETLLGFCARAVNAGEAPSDARWPDGQSSKQKFLNLRAEMWWRLRRRFEKTYEHVTAGVVHPPEEMISIPDHSQLIAELSQPLSERTESGKIKLESKPDMRRRGVKSPDFADALAHAFLEATYQIVPMKEDTENRSLIMDAPEGVFATGNKW